MSAPANRGGAAPARKSLRVNFVLPFYTPVPIGGYRVVYEYADFLAARGHAVSIIFPRLPHEPPPPFENARKKLWGWKTRLLHPRLVPWHSFHPQVRLVLAPDLGDASLPDADISVATAWTTAEPVAALSKAKGNKFYLIQHHEIEGLDDAGVRRLNATWRLPLRKIVISRWLEQLGRELGATDMRHIPNGIDLRRFRVTAPPDARPMSVLTLYHAQAIKGLPDALAVLRDYHGRFPSVPIAMFGAKQRGPEVPEWIAYHRNPPQEDLVRKLYNGSAVYLGASLAEGWALPPAEAMACGCAFVGTDIGGFREYATHNDTALLSPPGDRSAMLRNLVAITEDAELRRRIQSRGTENIQQFTWNRAGTALENYFLENVD